jgi:hypothetical protein
MVKEVKRCVDLIERGVEISSGHRPTSCENLSHLSSSSIASSQDRVNHSDRSDALHLLKLKVKGAAPPSPNRRYTRYTAPSQSNDLKQLPPLRVKSSLSTKCKLRLQCSQYLSHPQSTRCSIYRLHLGSRMWFGRIDSTASVKGPARTSHWSRQFRGYDCCC